MLSRPIRSRIIEIDPELTRHGGRCGLIADPLTFDRRNQGMTLEIDR